MVQGGQRGGHAREDLSAIEQCLLEQRCDVGTREPPAGDTAEDVRMSLRGFFSWFGTVLQAASSLSVSAALCMRCFAQGTAAFLEDAHPSLSPIPALHNMSTIDDLAKEVLQIFPGNL